MWMSASCCSDVCKANAACRLNPSLESNQALSHAHLQLLQNIKNDSVYAILSLSLEKQYHCCFGNMFPTNITLYELCSRFIQENYWTPHCACTAAQCDTFKTPWQMLSLAWPPVASSTIWPFSTQYTPPTMPSFTLLSQTEFLQYSISWIFTYLFVDMYIHKACTFIHFWVLINII